MAGMDAQNPILTPLRRWVLYSRLRLAGTAAASVVVLVVLGMATSPTPASEAGSSAAATTTSTGAAAAISYDLAEVSESMIAAKSNAWVTASAPATAMAYLHTYIDTKMPANQWSSKLSAYTATAPGPSFTTTRPKRLVAVTGPTRSEMVAGSGGARVARVSVPTNAGPMSLQLTVVEGRRWAVDAPLPTLELSAVDLPSAEPPSTAKPTPSSRAVTTTAPRSTAPSTNAPTAGNGTTSPAPGAGTVPVPAPPTGAIPLPELDTPLPGAL